MSRYHLFQVGKNPPSLDVGRFKIETTGMNSEAKLALIRMEIADKLVSPLRKSQKSTSLAK